MYHTAKQRDETEKKKKKKKREREEKKKALEHTTVDYRNTPLFALREGGGGRRESEGGSGICGVIFLSCIYRH